MAHILAVELTRRDCTGGKPYGPGVEPDNVATLWVDWDRMEWKVRTRKDEWLNIFHLGQGVVLTYQFMPDQSLAAPSGVEQMRLTQYGMNPQSKLSGVMLFGPNPNATSNMGLVKDAYLYYTYFWRKLQGSEMNKRERVEEMFFIATQKYGHQIGSDALAQVRDLATPGSLGTMGLILVMFATASALGIAYFVAALRVLCGVADVATNWVMYKPHWDRFAQQVNTGNDLDYGAEALATLLGGLLGYGAANIVAGKASAKAAPGAQHIGNKFANAVRGNSPARWRAAAEQGVHELKEEAEHTADGKGTKRDPGKELTAEDRHNIVVNQGEMLAQVRKAAIKFGFPPHIAEGYAMLAFHNKWTIFARTSKASSIPHHLLGAENVTGKSLFVEYKIDAKTGVILGEWGRNIEADFYSPHSYAAKQLEAIYYAENPGAPKGSFEMTPELLREFRAQHVFEFREVPIDGKPTKVLFHNGKMVISDIDVMGMYVQRGADLVPLPQWMIHNDAHFLQDYINRNVGGVDSSFHGQQDIGRSSKAGRSLNIARSRRWCRCRRRL